MRRSLHLGDTTSAKYAQISASAAGTAVGAGAANALIGASAAGPVGAAIAGIGIVIAALISNSGCGPTCVMASNIVDQLEPQLRQNRDTYLSGSRTTSTQAAALANFDTAWAWLTSGQACGAPELGNAGKRCISDRSPGGKWDWFAYYRDPISNDPQVVPDTSVLNMAGSALSGYALPLLLIAIGLLI